MSDPQRNEVINICYLCGQPLSGKVDKDHVPPRQFYPRELRLKHNLNLFTLPVHSSCNKAYQKDEDYFVHSVGPLTMESYSGNALWNDISKRFERPRGQKITEKVLKEFDERPSGLILPFGKVAKRFDGERVWRVVWKIVRGLFFKEVGQFLPDETPINCKMFSPGEIPPPKFYFVHAAPSLGQYPGVFDYKYIGIPGKIYFWAMLFWDRIIMFIAFDVRK